MSFEKEIPEHDGVVMCVVMRGIDERDRSILRELSQPLEFGGMPLDFRPVAPLKFRPTFGGMAEPFAQRRARSNRLHPFIDRGIRLPHSAWPQPVYKDSGSVFGNGRLVGPLDLDAVRALPANGFSPPVALCRGSEPAAGR